MNTPQFVVTWQAAASLDEVAEKAGIRRSSASARASRLRQRGVPLRNLRRIDYGQLAQLARDTANERSPHVQPTLKA